MKKIKNIKSSNYKKKLEVFYILLAFTLFSCSLLFFRIRYSGVTTFAFLIWNLFLAWIPYLIGLSLSLFEDKIKSKWLCIGLVLSWLIFFPNAPYIITDLFHLHERYPVPLWFDLSLLISFALNGLFLGLLSLNDIQIFLMKRTNRIFAWSFTLVSLFLAGFGLYLGRYLRWNSWDIVSNPFGLMKDILVVFIYPEHSLRAIGMTIVFFGLLTMCYLLLKSVARSSRNY